MRNYLWYNHSDTQLDEYHHPNCVPWDFRHFFDHHHWPNVKNLFPYRKQCGSKHARYNVIAKSSLKDRDIEEVLNFLGTEYDRTVEHATLKDISANKKSSMRQIKALIAKEMFKEEHQKEKQEGVHFPLGSKLQRTLSIHHFEPSDDWLAQKPITFIGNNIDPSLAKPHDVSHSSTPKSLPTCAKDSEFLDNREMKKDGSEHHSNEYVDVLEVFKVNKKLFREVAQDPMDRKLNHIYSLQNSKSRSRLAKLNSFPMVYNSSPSGKFMHAEHQKKDETLPSSKVESLLHGTRSPKFLASKSSVTDTKDGRTVKLDRCSSSPNSTNVLNNDRRLRRIYSLSNPMDRYSQLIEHRFSRDKFNRSKSANFAHEDGSISSGHDLNLESHNAILIDTNQDMSYGKDEPDLVDLPPTTEKEFPVSISVVETRSQDNYVIEEIDRCSTIKYASEVTPGRSNDEESDGSDEQIKYAVELSVHESINNSEEGNSTTRTSSSKIENEDMKFMDDAICIAESQASGGVELKASCVKSDDLSELNSLSGSGRVQHEKIDEKTSASFENYFSSNGLHHAENKANCNYNRDVLHKSGISIKWPSSNELCEYEVVDNWDHQLLYDLVDEILLDMNEKSHTYWPALLSHLCRIHPMPSEQRLLQEVGKMISNYLSLRSEHDPSLDLAMTQDLRKDGSWMNLQYDTEIIALEMEDIIIDDLLDEILFS